MIKITLGPIIVDEFVLSRDGHEITDALIAAGWVSHGDFFTSIPSPYSGQPNPMELYINQDPDLEFSPTEDPQIEIVQISVKIGVEAELVSIFCPPGCMGCPDSPDPTCCIADWRQIRTVYRTYCLIPDRVYTIICSGLQFFIFDKWGLNYGGNFVAGGLPYVNPSTAIIDGPISWWLSGTLTGPKLLDTSYLPFLRLQRYTSPSDPLFYRHCQAVAVRGGEFFVPEPDPCPEITPSPRLSLKGQIIAGEGLKTLIFSGATNSTSISSGQKWYGSGPSKYTPMILFRQAVPLQPVYPPQDDADSIDRIQFQLYDSVICSGSFPTGLIRNIDGRNFMCLSHEKEQNFMDFSFWTAVE